MRQRVTKCLRCKEPVKGRIDKKFCSDLCRNRYNNEGARDHTRLMRNTNNALRRNRKILEELYGNEAIKKDELIEKNFNFDYITEFKNTVRWCYEYGYQEIEQGLFLIVTI